jgi:2,5-diketo-D-gluconate reductase A
MHPNLCNEEVRAANAEHGIVTEAWSPLAKGRVLNDPAIGAIASRTGRTPAQVVLRWHVQRGNVIFPKSTTPARIKENFQIFDFELEPNDIAAISALNRDEEGRTRPNPDVFAWIPR